MGCKLPKLTPDQRLEADAALYLTRCEASELIRAAARRRDDAHGDRISYSRKIFIPLTKLCRDVCHYCTFAKSHERGRPPFLLHDQVLGIARAGQAAGCREALFTLGDRPEDRYRVASEALKELGHSSTISYLKEMAELVFRETGLLPHLNPGLLKREELAALRKVSASQGIMLESISDRLCERGAPHFGSPDKVPARRLETIADAGVERVPFTSGILIGIGETREERIRSLLALRELNDKHGHIQEIIVQNFRPKSNTLMAAVPAASLAELLWTVAVARLLFDSDMNIQVPPNLSPDAMAELIAAGINDWGGVSPVTPDHVNPEAPWPDLERLNEVTRSCGKHLVERLAIYPKFVRHAGDWLDENVRPAVLRQVDTEGYPRTDDWIAGVSDKLPIEPVLISRVGNRSRGSFKSILDRACAGATLSEPEIVRLFAARDDEFADVCRTADELRADVVGDRITYVITRNINYTNICSYRCQFCAFSKGKTAENLRGRPYDLPLEEIGRRASEAWARGATEVCMQGGIHPAYDGNTYLRILETVKRVTPDMHVHAFSPLEVHQGAATLGVSVQEFLTALKSAGLGSLPGTAAEILDDEVRAMICPDKIDTRQWLEIIRTAHRVGLKSTATIMFGHVDRYEHWARHLLHLRALQAETGGFTEFVPLPFVPMETPIFLKKRSRMGPSFREAVLMHAVARLVLHPLVPNIQTSWVKLGREGVRTCLTAGANDLGGTLMDETITRSAGAIHGQEMTPSDMRAIIHSLGRPASQRGTLYNAFEPVTHIESDVAASMAT